VIIALIPHTIISVAATYPIQPTSSPKDMTKNARNRTGSMASGLSAVPPGSMTGLREDVKDVSSGSAEGIISPYCRHLKVQYVMDAYNGLTKARGCVIRILVLGGLIKWECFSAMDVGRKSLH